MIMNKQSGVSNIIYGLLVIAILSSAIFGLTRLESTFDTKLSDINTEVASISASISSDPAISLGAAAEALVATSPLCKININSYGAESLTDTACNEDQLIASLFDGDGRAVEDQKSFSTSFEDGLCEVSYSDKNYVQIYITPYASSPNYSFSTLTGYFSSYNEDTKQYSGTSDTSKLSFYKLVYLNNNFCGSYYAITFKFNYQPPESSLITIPESYNFSCEGIIADESYIAALVQNNLGQNLCIAW